MDVHHSGARSEEVLQECVKASAELLQVRLFTDDAATRGYCLEPNHHAANGMLSPA